MKHWYGALWWICLVVSCSAALPVWAARGRVQIINNGAWDYAANRYDEEATGYTVATDRGKLLRGTSFWCFTDHRSHFNYATDFENWKKIPHYGFNAVRVAVSNNDADRPDAPVYLTRDAWLGWIDRWVDYGEKLGIYVILDHHEVGTYNMDALREFWSTVAPRYKDRTHVLFEVANEPIWIIAEWTETDVSNFQSLYHLIREHAPDTHIILFSFAIPGEGMDRIVQRFPDVDWSNASVGFHGYWESTSEHITRVKRKFPIINTEWMQESSWFPGSLNKMDGFSWNAQAMEQLRVSWISWDANHRPPAEKSVMIPLLEHAAENGYLWEPDTHTESRPRHHRSRIDPRRPRMRRR